MNDISKSTVYPQAMETAENSRQRALIWGKTWEIMAEEEARAKARREYLRMQNFSIEMFMKSEGYFCFDEEGCLSSQAIYDLYRRWCRDKGVMPEPPRTLWLHLKEHTLKYHLAYSMNIPTENGRHVRGFRGIRACSSFSKEEASAQHG